MPNQAISCDYRFTNIEHYVSEKEYPLEPMAKVQNLHRVGLCLCHKIKVYVPISLLQ